MSRFEPRPTPPAPPAVRHRVLARFALYFVPGCAAAALVLWAVHRAQVQQRLAELKRVEEKRVALQQESITRDFDAALTDLVLLSQSAEVAELMDQDDPPHRSAVAQQFLVFAEAKPIYDQIRLLDDQGTEVVRVNGDRRQSRIVPPGQLQAKGDRYYFGQAKQLDPGDVFVSSLDLNVEDGRIEQPIKPTLRLATTVVGRHGGDRGVLVLNYLGNVMLERFARLRQQGLGESMLLNSNGYWLYTAQPSKCWGFMYSQRRAVRFPGEFPGAWRRMAGDETGQFRDAQGLFTFQRVSPFAVSAHAERVPRERRPDPWWIVSRVSPADLALYLRGTRQLLAQLVLASLLILGGSSWAIARNAVRREASERHLRASETRFQQMAHSISEVFWLAGPNRRRLTYASPAFATIWGQPSGDIPQVQQQWLEAIEPDDREQAEAALFSDSGSAFSVQYRIRRPDGSIRWIWDHGFPVFEQGRLTGYAGIAEDVTQLKEAEQKLLQSARLAAVGEAITGLAHESRNALQRSQACLEMLRRRLSGQPECAQLADRIQSALRELHGIYERVRVFAAPVMLSTCRCDLRRLWDETCDKLRDEITRRRAQVTHVAEEKAETWAVADEVAIGQVFRNVLENALSEELDGRCDRNVLQIIVRWPTRQDSADEFLEIIISDNGPGLSEGLCQRVFDPFFTTRTRGTGLGLSICRRLMQAHGGSISARPACPHGLEVHLLLPRNIDHEVPLVADRGGR